MQWQLAESVKTLLFTLGIVTMLTVAVLPGQALAGKPGTPGDKPQSEPTPVTDPAQPAPAMPGAEPEKDVSPVREVVVSATKTEREVFDVPSSVAVVSKQQLEREPQGTIAQQLQDIPGVQVSDSGMGGGAKRVTIRGEGPARVLILIDGMKISEQKSMDGSMIMIDPGNIERIEVLKGPGSVLYGSEAIGGVVNIITKKGGTKPVQATLSTTLDTSNGSLTPFAALYGSYNGFSYRVSGDYTDAGDKKGGSGTIDNTSYVESNASAYLDYSWDGGKIGAGYDYFRSNINIPGADADGARVELDLPRWQRDRFYSFFELNKLSDTLQKIKFTGFFQETKKDFSNDITVNTRVTMSPTMYMDLDVWSHPFTQNTQKSYGGNLQTDWTFGDSHYVIAGLDYLYDDLEATDDRQGRTTTDTYRRMGPTWRNISHRETLTADLFDYDAHQQSLAAFAQDEWRFHEDWTATLGLRYTWIESSLDKTNDPTLDEGSSDDSHLVGSLGLVYSGFEDWRLRAQYSQGYRYPLLTQLYIGTTHGSSGRLYPNPDLKPETSQNFEVGTRYDANGITADLALYYNIADDYINSRKIAGTSDTIFENVDSASTYGAELSLSYTYDPWNLTPYVSGGYIYRTLERDENKGGETSQTGDPRWTGRAGLKYERDLTPVLSIHTDVFGRFACAAKESLTDGTMEHIGGWTTANFAVGARMGHEKNYFVDLNLNNLLDKRYTPASSSLEDPGFHAVLRMGVEF